MDTVVKSRESSRVLDCSSQSPGSCDSSSVCLTDDGLTGSSCCKEGRRARIGDAAAARCFVSADSTVVDLQIPAPAVHDAAAGPNSAVPTEGAVVDRRRARIGDAAADPSTKIPARNVAGEGAVVDPDFN